MGNTDRVIIFCFAGRRPNMELQVPMIRRILEQHPNVEYHIWNFAGDCGIGGGRLNSDREYLKTIRGPQITVINDYGPMKHNECYRHYTDPEYQDCLFVKIDDDVVFLETARFGTFIDVMDKYRGSVAVANLVHNGACTPVEPELWKQYLELGIPLLECHEHSDFAELAHGYFFKNWSEMLNQTVELIPTEDWLSINLVGYDWPTLCHVVDTIGKPHPHWLAGRQMLVGANKWPFGKNFGDEGVFQTLPRIIVKGFTAAHLTYGPEKATEEQLARWRQGYRYIGSRYLKAWNGVNNDPQRPLPALSAVSCGGPRNP